MGFSEMRDECVRMKFEGGFPTVSEVREYRERLSTMKRRYLNGEYVYRCERYVGELFVWTPPSHRHWLASRFSAQAYRWSVVL